MWLMFALQFKNQTYPKDSHRGFLDVNTITEQ